MDPPSAKKRKTQNSEASTHRCPDFWYVDGSVILQAESTQFRIHQGLLSTYSSILDDITRREEATDFVEECPVIHISDKAEDIECFLRMIYNRDYFRETKFQPLPVIVSILRISEKYCIASLHTQARLRFRNEFPFTMKAFESKGGGLSQMDPYPGIYFDVIQYVWTFKILQVLPAAFYTIVTSYSLREILKGVSKDDGSNVVLPPSDQHRCILGFEKLTKAQFEHTLSWLDEDKVPSSSCIAPRKCSEFKKATMLKFCKPKPKLVALRPWNTAWSKELCRTCKSLAKSSHSSGRKDIWAALPEYFNLSPWGALINPAAPA